VVFRYQLLYVYAPTRGGGRLWMHLRDGASQGALVAVGVLAAVLGWRGAPVQSMALAPLFVAVFVMWRMAAADDGGEAFRVLPRDVAAAADAEHGSLSTPLPFPFPESYYPLCMFDDVALLPDLPLDDARAAKEAKAAAAAARAERLAALAALEAGAAAEADAAAAAAAEQKPLKTGSGGSGYGSMSVPSGVPPPAPAPRSRSSRGSPPETESSQSDVEAPRESSRQRRFYR
jgi:pyruvate/2-oxoglutarate dehydrogenase complex dihydrolipoamide acyltransferase (E2) component